MVQNIQKSKVVKEQVESMNGKVDINKFGAKDDVEIDDDSHQPFQEKESDHSLKDIRRKAPSKEVRNVSYTVDIRIEKDEYDGSGDDQVIENYNHQIHQKEEHNLQTYAEDNGLTNICKMTVALECSEVSAFEVNLYIKSFHFIYSLILLLKTYKTSVTSIFCKNCLHFLSFDNFVLRCGKCLGISFLLPSFVNHCWLMTKYKK